MSWTQYSYFIGTLVMGAVWSALLVARPDLRRYLLKTSTLFGVLGFFGALFYNQDWWRPLTITHTYVGIEDFLFAFFIGGISVGVYKTVSGRLIDEHPLGRGALPLMLTVAAVYGALAVLMDLGLTSFHASMIVGLTVSIGICMYRHDLFEQTVLSGPLVLIALIPAYLIPELLNPGWFALDWTTQNLSGVSLFGIPIEDVAWVIVAGMATSSFYDVFSGTRLRAGRRP